MNKSEFQDAFSKVQASDSLMQAVLLTDDNQKPRTNPWRIARRVAACAAVLALLIGAMFFWPVEENYVTGPGVLVVRAYETDEPSVSDENSTILKEGIVVPMAYTWHPGISWTALALGLPFRFSVPEEDYPNQEVAFEIWLSGGDFESLDHYLIDFDDKADSYDIMRARYLGNHFTIPNNERLWWNRIEHIFDEQNREVHYVEMETDQVFVDVILRADNHIIGYAVIEILHVRTNRFGYAYHTRLLKSVSFPKVEGEYQKVSEKYVKEQIQLVHDHA